MRSDPFEIVISPPEKKDAGEISAMNAEIQQLHADAYPTFFKSPTEETFPAHLILRLMAQNNNYFYLAFVKEKPAGYIYAEKNILEETPFHYRISRLYIHQIGVRPAFQGRGCGARLINRIKKLAHQEKIDVIALDTWDFNLRAQGFFEHLGFTKFNLRYWLWPEPKGE